MKILPSLLTALLLTTLGCFTSLPAMAQGNERTKMSSEQVATELIDTVVSLNNATVEQLSSLKGIGEKKAKAIIAYRTQHGDFKSIDDLIHVKGIGNQIIDANKVRLKI